jgi:hypothetical protein
VKIMTQTATGPQAPESTGFELYEKMVGEHRAAGRSRTLDQWLAQVRQQLAQLKAKNPSPKTQKDIAAIEHACERAAELVATLASGKI